MSKLFPDSIEIYHVKFYSTRHSAWIINNAPMTYEETRGFSDATEMYLRTVTDRVKCKGGKWVRKDYERNIVYVYECECPDKMDFIYEPSPPLLTPPQIAHIIRRLLRSEFVPYEEFKEFEIIVIQNVGRALAWYDGPTLPTSDMGKVSSGGPEEVALCKALLCENLPLPKLRDALDTILKNREKLDSHQQRLLACFYNLVVKLCQKYSVT